MTLKIIGRGTEIYEVAECNIARRPFRQDVVSKAIWVSSRKARRFYSAACGTRRNSMCIVVIADVRVR